MNQIIFHNITTHFRTSDMIMTELRNDMRLYKNQKINISFSESHPMEQLPTTLPFKQDMRQLGWMSRFYGCPDDSTRPRVELIADRTDLENQFKMNIVACTSYAAQYEAALTIMRDDRICEISKERLSDIRRYGDSPEKRLRKQKTLVNAIMAKFAGQPIRPPSIFQFPQSPN